MSGSIFDWEPKPKEWYDSLPPLVKRGEDREAVIARIVEDWTTDLGETDPDKHIEKFKAQFGRSPVVENVAFVHEDEAVHPTPVDLGEVIRRVERRLRGEGHTKEVQPTPNHHILIRGCRLDRTSAENATLRPRWTCIGAKFEDKANFDGTTFGEGAVFGRARFGKLASFVDSTFGDGARFYCSEFGKEARFDRSTFGRRTSFEEARFEKKAIFHGSAFGQGSSFCNAHFGDKSSFHSCTFGSEAKFTTATFGHDAIFDLASFSDKTWFVLTKFRDRARFVETTFGDDTWFDDSTFGDNAWFLGATFGDRVRLVDSSFGETPAWGSTRFKGDLDTSGLTWGRRPPVIRRILDWSLVRSIAALPVLARISYLSLFFVPLLAGSWNAMSHYLRLTTPMSPAWAVAFFAAFFVSLGHLAYQLKAPQVIREKSRDDLVTQRLDQWANATEREQRDLLQRACDAIQAVARLRPWDRNPNLVRRHGEVVWIPGSLDELEAVAEWEKLPDPDLDEAIEHASSAEEHDAIEAERAERPRPRFSHDEFRQIVIDEGAKAEFDAAARETPGWCALSAFLYFSATVLVLWLTASQIAAVLAAVFEPDDRWVRIVDLCFFWAITILVSLLLLAGALRSAWRGKSARLVRAFLLWPLLAAAVTIVILRVAAQSQVPALDHTSFWVGIAAAAVVAVLGLVGCVGWVREQLKPPSSPQTG
jgi:hypothetical protein